jgi:hypothetical protein
MWRTSWPTLKTCADGSFADGEGLELAGAEVVVRERDCSARMSAGVTSSEGCGVESKRDGGVGRVEALRVRVRRRSARLGMSSGIVKRV